MGVTAMSQPSGARMRAISAALRGANTLSTIVAIPSRSGSGFHASAPTAAARGWMRGGAPEGGGGGVDGDAERVRPRVEHVREVVARAGAQVHHNSGTPRALGLLARASVSGRKCPARRNASRASTISGVSARPGTRFT